MATHYEYDQTAVQREHLRAADPSGFCESAVGYWHYSAFKVEDFVNRQMSLMNHFRTNPAATRLIRQLQDRPIPSFTYDPTKYAPDSTRLEAMGKCWKLKDTAALLNKKLLDVGLDYDPPGRDDAGKYKDKKDSVWNTVNTVGNLCYVMLRSAAGGHGIGTYRPDEDHLYLFDPNQGVFICSKLLSFSDYHKHIINHTIKNTSLGAITKIAVIRAVRKSSSSSSSSD